MPYLTPSYVGEQYYASGIGALTMSLVDTPQVGDLLVACIEYQGGDTNPTITGWTAMTAISTGTGTAHVAARILTHRWAGSAPSYSVPDTGNHTSVSLHLFRNIDRVTALSAFTEVTAADTTANTNLYATAMSGAGSGAASTQGVICVCFGAASDISGGSTLDYPTDSGDWTKTDVRQSNITAGSGGFHAVVLLTGNGSKGTTQPRWVTTNSNRDVRAGLYLLAHTYTEYTRTSTDGLTSSDSASRLGAFTRAIADALQSADAVTRLGAYARGIADSLGLADAVARVQGFVRGLSDAAAWTESLKQILGKTASESVGFSEALEQLKTLFRDVTDALGLSDVATKVISKIRAITESLRFSESVDRFVTGIKAVVVSAVTAMAKIVASVAATAAVTVATKATAAIRANIYQTDDATQIVADVEATTDIEVDIA